MVTESGMQASDPQSLRLAVLDEEDLAVVSAHLQDAETTMAAMAYLPRERRFALVLARLDWPRAFRGQFERCRTGLHFERVLQVARTGLASAEAEVSRNLLAITFTPEDAPSGTVLLTFAGGAQIRLTVECLEAEMRDLGPRWVVEGRPTHPDGASPAREGAAAPSKARA